MNRQWYLTFQVEFQAFLLSSGQLTAELLLVLINVVTVLRRGLDKLVQTLEFFLVVGILFRHGRCVRLHIEYVSSLLPFWQRFDSPLPKQKRKRNKRVPPWPSAFMFNEIHYVMRWLLRIYNWHLVSPLSIEFSIFQSDAWRAITAAKKETNGTLWICFLRKHGSSGISEPASLAAADPFIGDSRVRQKIGCQLIFGRQTIKRRNGRGVPAHHCI